MNERKGEGRFLTNTVPRSCRRLTLETAIFGCWASARISSLFWVSEDSIDRVNAARVYYIAERGLSGGIVDRSKTRGKKSQCCGQETSKTVGLTRQRAAVWTRRITGLDTESSIAAAVPWVAWNAEVSRAATWQLKGNDGDLKGSDGQPLSLQHRRIKLKRRGLRV